MRSPCRATPAAGPGCRASHTRSPAAPVQGRDGGGRARRRASRWLTRSQGTRMQRVRFGEDGHANQRAGGARPIALDGDRAPPAAARRAAGWSARAAVRARRTSPSGRWPGPAGFAFARRRLGSAAIDQRSTAARSPIETANQSIFPVSASSTPNGAIISAKQRKVLELVVAVFETVQRFGVERPHHRLPPGEEVDHLAADPRRRRRRRPAGPARSGRTAGVSRHISTRCAARGAAGVHASRERPPPQADQAGGNQHGADADAGQLHQEEYTGVGAAGRRW